MNAQIQNIVRQLTEVQTDKIWIGTNFNKKLSEINEESAFIRPIPNLHSVAELISHLTTWRKETLLKIKTGEGSITDDDESNWLNNEILKKKGWKELLSEYEGTLTELIGLLESRQDQFLDEKYYDTDFKDYYEFRFVIEGMLHHDLYHLGQLGIVIKLLKEKE